MTTLTGYSNTERMVWYGWFFFSEILVQTEFTSKYNKLISRNYTSKKRNIYK